MPRRNSATHGRRLKAHPVTDVLEAAAITGEAMAQDLVRRGLATKSILDQPDNPHTPTKQPRTATTPSNTNTRGTS